MPARNYYPLPARLPEEGTRGGRRYPGWLAGGIFPTSLYLSLAYSMEIRNPVSMLSRCDVVCLADDISVVMETWVRGVPLLQLAG